MMYDVAHRIEIKPKKKQLGYFYQSFGCSRLAYNWALHRMIEDFTVYRTARESAEERGVPMTGEERALRPDVLKLKKEFNALKVKEFPFVYEVSKYVTQQPFIELGRAFSNFFRRLKAGEKPGFPRYKRKHSGEDSFYIGGDQIQLSDYDPTNKDERQKCTSAKRQFVKIPNLGWVKMQERLRFNGKVRSATFSRSGSRLFVSFQVQIDEAEMVRTHPYLAEKPVGESIAIDAGLKSKGTLSTGEHIENERPLKILLKKIKKVQRQMSRCVYPKTKADRDNGVKPSNHFLQLARKLGDLMRRVTNIRTDSLQKLTTVLVRNFDAIVIEDLNLKGMVKNHRLAGAISDTAIGRMFQMLEYKSGWKGTRVIKVDRFYPSSKTCSCCGNVKKELKLSERIYRCEKCGMVLDRDYNASLNLLNWAHEKMGVGHSFKPLDCQILRQCLDTNRIRYKVAEDRKPH